MTPSALALPVMRDSKAHRGDSKNREMRCHVCHELGHRKAQCPKGSGKTSGADKALAEQFKELTAKAAGGEIAARELAVEVRELKVEREGLTKKSVELDSLKALLTRTVDFEVAGKIGSFRIELGWVLSWRALFFVLFLLAPCYLVCMGFYLAGVLSLLQAIAVASGFRRFFGGRWWWIPRRVIAYLREQDHTRAVDLRPDANALQEAKHADPQLNWLRISPWWGVCGWGSRDVLVSMEFVAQLTAPRFLSFANTGEVAFGRMVRAAESYQWIQFSRWDTLAGRSVPMNSALVAWAIFQKITEERLVDFLGAPQL